MASVASLFGPLAAAPPNATPGPLAKEPDALFDATLRNSQTVAEGKPAPPAARRPTAAKETAGNQPQPRKATVNRHEKPEPAEAGEGQLRRGPSPDDPASDRQNDCCVDRDDQERKTDQESAEQTVAALFSPEIAPPALAAAPGLAEFEGFSIEAGLGADLAELQKSGAVAPGLAGLEGFSIETGQEADPAELREPAVAAPAPSTPVLEIVFSTAPTLPAEAEAGPATEPTGQLQNSQLPGLTASPASSHGDAGATEAPGPQAAELLNALSSLWQEAEGDPAALSQKNIEISGLGKLTLDTSASDQNLILRLTADTRPMQEALQQAAPRILELLNQFGGHLVQLHIHPQQNAEAKFPTQSSGKGIFQNFEPLAAGLAVLGEGEGSVEPAKAPASPEAMDARFARLLDLKAAGRENSGARSGQETGPAAGIPATEAEAVVSGQQSPQARLAGLETGGEGQKSTSGMETVRPEGAGPPQTLTGAGPAQNLQANQQPAASTAATMLRLPSGVLIPEAQIISQVADRIGQAGAPSSIVIKMEPAELGELQLRLVLVNKQIKGTIRTANSEVREILERSMPRLREALEVQGLKIDELKVSLDNEQLAAGRDPNQQAWDRRRNQSQGAAAGSTGRGGPAQPDPARLAETIIASHRGSSRGLSVRI